jgi:hypothetical protein
MWTGPGRRGSLPGPVGRQHVFADADGSNGSGGQTPASKGTALIIVGAGQSSVKQGRTEAQFDQALRQYFDQYVKGYNVTLKHVSSAKEMIDQIAGSTWDVVIYFGHGVLSGEQLLAPGSSYSAPLKPDDLASALQKAGTSRVYIFGCDSALTGLARYLSKQLKGTSVTGMSDDLEVKWKSKTDKQGTQNEMTFKGKPSEYVNGQYMENGKAAARRPHERLDPLTTDGPGGPGDDSMPNDPNN